MGPGLFLVTGTNTKASVQEAQQLLLIMSPPVYLFFVLPRMCGICG